MPESRGTVRPYMGYLVECHENGDIPLNSRVIAQNLSGYTSFPGDDGLVVNRKVFEEILTAAGIRVLLDVRF